MPRLRSYLLLLLCCTLLIGCWDRREIEERIFVSALGIDHTSKEGDLISFQVPIPSQIVGGGSAGGAGSPGGDGGSPTELFVEHAQTINQASQNLKNKLSGSIFFGYAQLLLIGQEKAKHGIEPFLAGLRQHPQFRREFWPIVVEGEARKFLKHKSDLEKLNAAFVNELIKTGLRKGRIPEVTLQDLLVNLSNPVKRNPILNTMTINKEGKITWSGIAIFYRDKMLDILRYPESDILNHIRDQKPGRYIAVSCADQSNKILGFRPTKATRSIRVTEEPAIQIDVNIQGNVNEESCGKQFDQLDAPKQFAKRLEKQYERTANQLMQKAQKQYQTDFFLLGDYIESYQHKIWKKINWERDFPQIPIRVNYHVKVDRFNLLIE